MVMESSSIERALATAEAQVAAGHSLSGSGFWAAVATVKTDGELVDRYADRIAAIDQTAFAQWALLTVPKGVGTSLAFLGTGAGLGLVGASYSLDGLLAAFHFYPGFGGSPDGLWPHWPGPNLA